MSLIWNYEYTIPKSYSDDEIKKLIIDDDIDDKIDFNDLKSSSKKIKNIILEIMDVVSNYEEEYKYRKSGEWDESDGDQVEAFEKYHNELYCQLKYLCNYYIPKKALDLYCYERDLKYNLFYFSRFDNLSIEQEKEKKTIIDILNKARTYLKTITKENERIKNKKRVNCSKCNKEMSYGWLNQHKKICDK